MRANALNLLDSRRQLYLHVRSMAGVVSSTAVMKADPNVAICQCADWRHRLCQAECDLQVAARTCCVVPAHGGPIKLPSLRSSGVECSIRHAQLSDFSRLRASVLISGIMAQPNRPDICTAQGSWREGVAGGCWRELGVGVSWVLD